MPSVVKDTSSTGKKAIKPGLMYGVGTGIGGAMFGPIGTGLGGIVAGSQMSGPKGSTFAALAVSQAVNQVLFASQSGGGSRRRM